MEYSKSARAVPSTGRTRLGAVIRAAGDVIRLEDALKALGLQRNEAAKLLSRWVSQGWLRRVGRGAYVVAPLDAPGSEHVLEDPWVLVPALFAPAYIGGRTAAEHWDLTEQLFRDIVVMTGQPVRTKSQERHGARFTLKHVGQDRIFGTKAVWRGRTKIAVSDAHRTIVDMMDDPAIGGGIEHVADCLRRYLQRPDRDDGKVIEYAGRLGNGAVFKRLGFLAESDPRGAPLAERCGMHLTKGNARLDPALDSRGSSPRWLCAVTRREDGTGFLITAYPTDAVKAGETIWTKSR